MESKVLLTYVGINKRRVELVKEHDGNFPDYGSLEATHGTAYWTVLDWLFGFDPWNTQKKPIDLKSCAKKIERIERRRKTHHEFITLPPLIKSFISITEAQLEGLKTFLRLAECYKRDGNIPEALVIGDSKTMPVKI